MHNKENQCTVLSAEDLILLADLVGDIHFFRTVYAVSADDFSVFEFEEFECVEVVRIGCLLILEQ